VVQWAAAGDVGVVRQKQEDFANNNASKIPLESLLRIYGTLDVIVRPHVVDTQPSGSPDKACTFHSETEMIVGGNHAGFGHYGPQLFPRRDLERTISLDEQQAKIVKWTTDFILEKNKQ